MVFNTEFVISLSVAVIFVLGTYFSIPPFQTVIDINDSIKARHERVWGSPPYGHAELSSLQFFCKKMELDADNAVKLLNQQNLREISKNKTLKEIAKTNGIAPQQVYLFIKASNKISEHQPSGNGSGLMPSGLGRKTLAQGAREYHFDLEAGISKLSEQNIKASPDMTFREVAEAGGLSPMEVFEQMRGH